MKNGLNSAARALSETATQKQILTKMKNKIRLTARAAAPVFGAILLNLLVHEAAHAQGGGPIFSGNSGNLANIIREGLKLFAILLFCGGALGIGAAIWNKMWGKEMGQLRHRRRRGFCFRHNRRGHLLHFARSECFG